MEEKRRIHLLKEREKDEGARAALFQSKKAPLAHRYCSRLLFARFNIHSPRLIVFLISFQGFKRKCALVLSEGLCSSLFEKNHVDALK